MTLITEATFRSVCAGVYHDREQIYEFNPAVSHAEVLLWMVLGSLVSLLSLKDEEMPVILEANVENYIEAICGVVESHREGEFDPRNILINLIERVENNDNRSSTDY